MIPQRRFSCPARNIPSDLYHLNSCVESQTRQAAVHVAKTIRLSKYINFDGGTDGLTHKPTSNNSGMNSIYSRTAFVSGLAGLLVLMFLASPWSTSSGPVGFSLALDLDDADGDQALSSLDVSAGQIVEIQIFGTGVRDASSIAVRIGFDASKVVYVKFDAGELLPGARVTAIRDSASVRIDVDGLSGSATMNAGLVGTLRLGILDHFSEAEIRLLGAELVRGGRTEILFPNLGVALQVAASLSSDFDGSGLVDFADFVLFAGVFGYRVGDAKYEAKYDLNGNGAIVFDDFVAFAQGFGSAVNRAPVFAPAPQSTRSLPENAPAGRPVGDPVSATDPDGDTLTYSLWGIDAGHFTIDAVTGQIRTVDGAEYDYETRTRYSVVVRASDGRGGRVNVVIGIVIQDVEEPGPPDRPGAPRVTRVTGGLRVDWTSPPDNGSPINDYDVRYRAGDSGAFTDWPHDGPLTTTTITGLGITLYQVQVRAGNSEGRSDWSPAGGGRPLAPGEVAVPDSSLRSVLAEALGKPGPDSPINADDMTSLTVLSAGGRRVKNLEGIQHAVNLQGLYLGYNLISDISLLADLTGLRILWINSNPISDASEGISALTNLTSLEELHLQSIGVTDFSPLSALTNLKTLYLGQSVNVPDVSLLSGLVNLERLYFISGGLSDIAPLASLSKLHHLDLERNNITDLSPLAGLTQLNRLNLRYNRIADISPLVENGGLTGAGDEIDLRDNPLNPASVKRHVPALQAKSVSVLYDEVLITVDSEPQIYNDNVYVLPVSDVDLRSFTSFSGDRLIRVVNGFFSNFKDEFDFIFVVANLQLGEGRYPFVGANFPVSNQVRGIGQVYADEEGAFGSRGRLKCVLFLVERDGIRSGPMLHELMHQWAAYIVVSGFGGHWGFSSANGQLGGFAANDLVALGNGRYTAGNVVTHGYADNSLPYSSIELYLAGLLPAGRVPDLLVAEGASWLLEDGRQVTEDGLPVFSATGIRNYAIEDIVGEYGTREPGFADSQKDFRAAAIFLIDRDHPGTREQLDGISADVFWFSMAGSDTDDSIYNFHEATRGVARIRMDGLHGMQK